ncbi:hypothetical protein B9Z55_008172 [Caenorhabditis nigoni]|uniref:Hyaluronan/mRNA-binding protein domain-containing protein n=1 Tax=Caenorhabditis nigoni TaxID=1611254 RepID=A0A2G5VDG3_9PELO|nr:hypothetical protein B9Z55_008172 [Caenorhabditis nigoni]
MTEYGCQVTNKFGLPSDDDSEYDDPRELMQKVSQIALKKKEEKAVKPAQPTKPVAAAPASAAAKTDGASAGRGRGGRGRGRGGAAGRPRDGGDRVSNENNGERSGDSRRGGPRRGGERGAARPAGRGGRGGFTRENREGEESRDQHVADDGQDTRAPRRRGGFTLGGPSGGRGGSRGGRGRQFDRQSGSDRTGVRAFEKKDGHGKGNWGDQKDELAGETENIAPEGETAPAEPEVPREKTAEELAFEAEQEVLAKQKTLKEFRAAQNAEAPKFNTRKAGEGAADNFGKLVPMKKEVIPDREEDEVVVIHKAPRKQVLDISITFRNDRPERERNDRDHRRHDDRSERPQRGGQRGGRGGRGGPRSGGQGGRHQATPFNASEDAFPALGAK